MDKHGTDIESGRGPRGLSYWRLIADQAAITPEVAKWDYEGSGTEEDPYVVNWIDNDPRNPMIFPRWRKWLITMTVAVATLAVAFVSSAYTGGIEQIIQEFGASTEVVTLGVSLFVLGFAIGPLLWAPFSELYGRQILFIATYAALTAFNAGAAGSQNIQTLIVLRFFAGAFGSSPLTNAGGVIADMFPAKERGLAMSIFSAAPFMGPVLGPIVGGFLGETEGWRWVEGLMAIFTGTLCILGAILVPETYSPVLLRKRAAKLSKMTGKVYMSKGDVDQGKVSVSEAFKTALSRPWILLFREPIVLLLSIYMAIIYGTLYLMFGAFPIVYQQYRGWSTGIGGLAFLGVAIGMLSAVLYTIVYDNKRYVRVVDKAGGFAAPEARLPPAILGGILLPVGLFWFAWTNSPSIHYLVSIAAGVPFGFGMVLVFLSIMNYLIDAYTIFAASVLAANSVLRSLFGAAFPLFTTQMYASLGIHWASSIPAFLALACVPFPFLFYKYGATIRQRCKYAAEADAFMKRMMGQRQQEEQNDGSDEGTAEREEEKEENAEQEAFDYSFEEQKWPETPEEDTRFESIKGARSRRSSRTREPEWADNPYDIDRVHTRESFRSRSRSGSVQSRPRSLTRVMTGRSGKSVTR